MSKKKLLSFNAGKAEPLALVLAEIGLEYLLRVLDRQRQLPVAQVEHLRRHALLRRLGPLRRRARPAQHADQERHRDNQDRSSSAHVMHPRRLR